MSTDAIFAVTRAGLDYERSRMEAASRRIALADQPLTGRAGAVRGTDGDFASRLVDGTTALQEEAARAMSNGGDAGGASQALDAGDTRSAADAGGVSTAPLSDAGGRDVDLAQEMTSLMSAQRAYQADIRAFNVLHGMLLKSLTIGSR